MKNALFVLLSTLLEIVNKLNFVYQDLSINININTAMDKVNFNYALKTSHYRTKILAVKT